MVGTKTNMQRSMKLNHQSVALKRKLNCPGFGAAPVKAEGSASHYDNAQESFTARYNP